MARLLDKQDFWLGFTQSVLLIFLSEIGDRVCLLFILILIRLLYW